MDCREVGVCRFEGYLERPVGRTRRWMILKCLLWGWTVGYDWIVMVNDHD